VEYILSLLAGLAGIGALVCFIVVLFRAIQARESKMVVLCLASLLCLGIGFPVAYVYGWVRARAWGITTLMVTWTVLIVLAIILGTALQAATDRW
jgi:hypothetical protein